MRSCNLMFAVAAIAALHGAASAADWLTSPSFYTHDGTTGQRVTQFAQIGPYHYFQRPDYLKSGYRQFRSTIDYGNSSDNMHVVEQWGAAVVPYEVWRFNYRPYSTPYPAWGPPFGGLGGGTGGYPYSGGSGANIFGGGFFPGGGFGGGFGGGVGGFGGGGMGGGFPGLFGAPATNFAQPWLDGHYPSYDLNDRSQYWKPYQSRP